MTNHLTRTTKQGSSFDNEIKETNTFLRNNKNILITKADKDNVTVVIAERDSNKRALQLLGDEATYLKVNTNPTRKMMRENNKIVQALKEKKGYRSRYILKTNEL